MSAGGPSANVDHIGIVVPDLDAAAALYRDILGCVVSERIEPREQGIAKVFVSFGNLEIELIEPTTPDSPLKALLEEHNASDFLARHPTGGLHHVCYAVSDLESARGALAAGGYRVLGTGAGAIGTSGRPILFLDPGGTDGVLVELKQARS